MAWADGTVLAGAWAASRGEARVGRVVTLTLASRCSCSRSLLKRFRSSAPASVSASSSADGPTTSRAAARAPAAHGSATTPQPERPAHARSTPPARAAHHQNAGNMAKAMLKTDTLDSGDLCGNQPLRSCGSFSADFHAGADSPAFGDCLARAYAALAPGGDFHAFLARSFQISSDMAHGARPRPLGPPHPPRRPRPGRWRRARRTRPAPRPGRAGAQQRQRRPSPRVWRRSQPSHLPRR